MTWSQFFQILGEFQRLGRKSTFLGYLRDFRRRFHFLGYLWYFRSCGHPVKAPFFILQFSYLCINDFPDNVICNIAIYVNDTTLCSKCDQVSDMWQQLNLASELESYQWDTMDRGKKWLVDFNAGRTKLVSYFFSIENCVKFHKLKHICIKF